MTVRCFYRLLGTNDHGSEEVILNKIQNVDPSIKIAEIKRELCFYVELTSSGGNKFLKCHSHYITVEPLL